MAASAARIPSTLPRALGFLLALAALPVVPRPAAAQVTLVKEDFEIVLRRDDGTNMSTTEQAVFFSRGRCECGSPLEIVARTSAAGDMKRGMITEGNIRLMVGKDCTDRNATERDKRCQEIATSSLVDFFSRGFRTPTTAKVIAAPKGGPCEARRFQQGIWLFVDLEPDEQANIMDGPVLNVTFDAEPPAAPAVEVGAGHEALVVKWTTDRAPQDLDGYQVFCSRGGDISVFCDETKPLEDCREIFSSVRYQTSGNLCPEETPAAPAAAVAPAPADPAKKFPAFGPLKDLNPFFVCSNHVPATQTSVRISTLQNGIGYLVGVAAVDKHGNASPLTDVYLMSPVTSKDFYRGYREDGGLAGGGFCSAGGAGAAGTGGATALGTLLAALAARRRRR